MHRARGREPTTTGGERAIADDTRNVAAFCAAHHRRLVGLLSLHVGDVDVAEELAQDVLATLCEHWPRLDDPAAWVTRVAVNHANSWWRRQYARRRALARRCGEQVEPPPSDRATAMVVRAAVAGLPTRQRTALVYRYYAGFSVTETASTMACAQGTVRALTHQALANLREHGALADDERTSHA